MATVELEKATKIFPGGVVGVKDVDLKIADGEFLVLVGPSGCGKSTTLRLIAGLETITSGTVSIGDRVVNNVAPKDRDIAMVFQNYALYPHMTVYKNMAFGLKLRKYPRNEIDTRVKEAAELLGIQELLGRDPDQLSGGQRQRVAVGRAIVRDPQAFLFDEPLSNLDAKLRTQMRAELKRLHRRLRTTSVYVTHDQEEAMSLGDRVVVLKDGFIHQVGTPLEVYNQPANRFVAGFIGSPPMNFLEGKLVRRDEGFYFDTGSVHLRIPDDRAGHLGEIAGQEVILGIRPQALGLRNEGRFQGKENSLEISVEVVEPLGEHMDLYFSTPQYTHQLARVEARSDMEAGQEINLYVAPHMMHIFEPGEEGENLTVAEA
jgi:multiple sugar transport system ATP-binding protein